jgi:hypothetical protein
MLESDHWVNDAIVRTSLRYRRASGQEFTNPAVRDLAISGIR